MLKFLFAFPNKVRLQYKEKHKHGKIMISYKDAKVNDCVDLQYRSTSMLKILFAFPNKVHLQYKSTSMANYLPSQT